MRRFVATLVVAALVVACGGTAATPSAPPTVAPAPTPTIAPSPTATLAESSAPATAGASGSGAFVVAGLLSTLDVSGALPDPSSFATSFASETPTIYVPYQLGAGLAGKVTSTWKFADGETIVSSFDFPAGGPWGYFTLTFKDGFIPGDYQEILRFEPTGESVTLPFTITGPRRAPASPTPVPSGTSAFTLLRAATAADTSMPLPDPSTYTDSFPTTASAIFVVFSLRSGLTGRVTCTMTSNGTGLIQPLSLDYGSSNGWGDFQVTPSGTFPPGDYVATVTYAPTGEAQTVTFTVK